MSITEAKLSRILKDRPFRFHHTIQSTNDDALAWLRQDAVDGSLVITRDQTAGRGRLKRGWYTPPDSALTCSIILRCDPIAAQQSTMLAAVSVFDLLDDLAIQELAIKWPNDIMVNGRKISGILAESLWSGEEMMGVVLGIGINLSVDFSATPLADRAISLHQLTRKELDPATLLTIFLRHFDRWRCHLGRTLLFRTWRSRLQLLGQWVTVDQRSGIAKAVDEEGALWLELANGEEIRILSGTLEERRD
ncbi:MAG: biotin--[acetyl-CoA-carboxylase] ligase [Anaerolineaceae bacterium]|nr:biotin--[acetyl-CoA-carboxylase] ligase [Anaerolineaceae bacterium]